jgi:predicted ATPase/class 3 adenylate cyclase
MTAFLFTDIEGSTELWERHPYPMRIAHQQHSTLIEAAVDDEGGRVVKDTGDGVFAVFEDPNAALRSAVAAQIAITAADWGEVGDLRIRAGLHVGHADVVADGDLHGRAPNRGARVMAAGHGGQILASAAFVAAASDPGPVDLVSLGQHRLKGLTEPTELFQVQAPGLTSEFPPIRTLDGLPNNLPVSLSRFIGRDDATEHLLRLLDENRLVTLVGAGGSGKTRLSLHIAAELLDQFSDGVWFVDLAGLGEPELVAPSVANALRIADQPGRDWLDSLSRFVADRELLVVFDNCEHLLDATAAVVTLLLTSSARSRIVATSREVLNLPGEQIWPVASLGIPAATDSTSKIRASEAVALFLDRAASARPGYEPTEGEMRSIVDICRRLDGLPLAIELAAARVQVLPVDEIAARLDDRFRFLVGGSRTVIARQRTLEATVAWSHQLLDPDEQSIFERLSIFAGSFSLAAAERVCAELPMQVFDGVTELVEKSLLEPVRASGEARYRMLETLRMFGRDRLVDDGAMATARDRLVDWVVDLVDEAEPGLYGADQLRWHAILDTEIDNIRSAMQWALEHLDAAASVSIAGGLHRYWFDRSPREGHAWLSRVLGLDVEDVPTGVLARAEIAYGHMLQVMGDDQGSVDWCRRALGRLSDSTESARAGWAQHYACRGLWGLDQLEDALDQAAGSMSRFKAADDSVGVLLSGMYVTVLNVLVGDPDKALALIATLDELSATGVSPALAAHTDETAAATHAFAGDGDTGRRRIRLAIEKYRSLGEHPCVAHALTTAAFFTTDADFGEAAALLHGKSLAMWEEAGLVVPPWERIANREVEDYCSSVWSPAELAALYDRGGTFTIDEAIDLALEATGTQGD